jgi:hypothetical protein
MKQYHFCLFLSLCLFGAMTEQLLAAEPFQFVENDKKQLSLSEGTLPILTYQYDVIEHEHVPQNDLRRTAGCYVHPLHGINGEILTDNAPKDHYHHHGVFWTWPHVRVHEPDGKVSEYDLWTSNTALKQHFVRWIDKKLTDTSATFEVENGWFIGNPKDNKKIMTEQVKVIVHRVQQVDDLQSRAVDFEFQWQPVGKPLSLEGSEGKSYGGFSMRLKPYVAEGGRSDGARQGGFNMITVPSGIAEKDLPETPLAWTDYTSMFSIVSASLSGAAIFVPKSHPDFPPTWLTRYYGPLCVGWPGVKERTFQPGEKIELRYRIWIHNGMVSVPMIEKAYNEYAQE